MLLFLKKNRRFQDVNEKETKASNASIDSSFCEVEETTGLLRLMHDNESYDSSR